MSKDLKDVSESSKCTEVGERGTEVKALGGQHGSCARGAAQRPLCRRQRAGVLRIHLETNNMCPVAIVWAFNLN